MDGEQRARLTAVAILAWVAVANAQAPSTAGPAAQPNSPASPFAENPNSGYAPPSAEELNANPLSRRWQPYVPPSTPVPMTDAYGNAQFDLPDRRPLSLYGVDPEGDSLGAYNALSRPAEQRGGPMAFALPGELLGLRTMQALAESASPSVFADVTEAKRRAMSQYGGFGDRGFAGEDGIASAFSRRYRIIAANSNYAPVYRAMMNNSALSGLRSFSTESLAPIDSVNAPNLPQEVTEPQTSLYDLLRNNADAQRGRAKSNAWALFEEGEYRQAARAFEANLVLDDADGEARVGEIFSYVALGSLATAAVLVQQFDRRDPNPFSYRPDVRGKLESAGLLDAMLIENRLRAEAVETAANPNVVAACAFILWYLGDRETALRAAEGLARRPDAAVYAGWPGKMRAVDPTLPGAASR